MGGGLPTRIEGSVAQTPPFRCLPPEDPIQARRYELRLLASVSSHRDRARL